MKRPSSLSLIMAAALTLSSCTGQQLAGTVTGSQLGGMLGSSIGGLTGGWRGSNRGTLAGMIIGGAVGAAVTAPRDKAPVSPPSKRQNHDFYEPEDTYAFSPQRQPASSDRQTGGLEALEVRHVTITDDNGNGSLERDEAASVTFDIYNTGNVTLYNVTPVITADSKKITMSTPTRITSIAPGAGVRYRAFVTATGRLHTGTATFTIGLSSGQRRVTAGTFKIRTQ